jgi:hypothetical protein
MTEDSESTPFLADNDHDDNDEERENHVTMALPASYHFKYPLKILTIVISLLCISIVGLLIASYILLKVGPFENAYLSQDGTRDLAIGVSTIFLVLYFCFRLEISQLTRAS